MLLDLTKLGATTVALEAMQLCVQQRITPELRGCTKLYVAESAMNMDVVVSLVGHFMKKLVKNEEITDKKESSTTTKRVDDYYTEDKLIRPVDYLLAFILAYIPRHKAFTRMFRWLLSRQRRSITKIPINTTNTTNTTIEHQTVNHYHCIPWDLKKSGYEARFAMWGETYYEGTPEEWGDLRRIRDYILAVGMSREPLSSANCWDHVFRLTYESHMKKRVAGE